MKKLNLPCRILCCYFALYMAMPMSAWAQLTINPPTFPTTNTVRVTLSGAQQTNAHIILFTPDLATNPPAWTRVVTGAVGQVTFDLTRPTNDAVFFRAAVAPVTTPTAATPVFTPDGGSYSAPMDVTISCATPGAAIYYTTDGDTPTISDTFIYNGGSVHIASVITLKAKAFAFGYNDSAVATATYSINSAPVVSPGFQQTITSSSTTLQGYVSDDGLTGVGTVSTNWTKLSGPGTVTFGNSHQTNTTAAFSQNGIYVLELSASDGQYTSSDQVTIAVNPTLSVSMTAPADDSTYTVPTNILLQATASCSSGSVTQLLFYANSTLIGAAESSDGSTFSLQWKSVLSGNQALSAVAISDDVNNYSIASDPVNITVNWPTNVGQVTMSQNDLTIPASGLPIFINREYDTRYGTSGALGSNWKLDYENIKIEQSGSLASGWLGVNSGISYGIQPTVQHLVTVTLDQNQQYYFVAQAVFDQTGTPAVNSAATPDCYNFFTVHLICTPLTQGKLDVSLPGDDVGMDDQLSGWNQSLSVVNFDDDDGFPISDYEPDFSQFTFTAPDGTKYGFNSDGTVASKTDRNGNSISYGYSGITHSSGKQVSFTRDGNNRITEIYDPIALATSGSPAFKYDYDDNGNLTNIARLVQRSSATYENTSFAYTNTSFPHNITAITDPRGVVSQRYEYDSSGRIIKQFDALGRPTTYSYDTANHRQTITDRSNHPTTQSFSADGQLAAVLDAAGGVTSYGYDGQGLRIAETNAAGQISAYAYDSDYHLIGVTNGLTESSIATYNEFGEVLVSVDARGNGTTNGYDSAGNLIATTNALGIVTRFGYDSQGNLTAQTNAFDRPEQVVVLNEYNEFGWLTNTVTLNAALETAAQISYTYDDNGNKLTETKKRTLPGGANAPVLTQWTYDAANRVLQTIDANGYTNQIAYNAIGKRSLTIDGLGRTNLFFYGTVGLLTNETFPDGLFESYSYDPEGHRTALVNRSFFTNSYSYDLLGRLQRTTYPDGSYTESAYNGANQVSVEVLSPISSGMTPSGEPPIVTSYGYDAAGERVSITNALGQTTYFTYDANGNQASVIDALNHTNTQSYDALNREVRLTYPDNSYESYRYDGLNRRVAVTNQAGIVTRYGYDALGNLLAVTNAFGTAQQTIARYTYDEVGNLLQQIDALNHTNKFEYDGMGHRIKETLPGNQVATSGYDAAGNLIRHTNFNSVILTNQYDALNRLTNKASVNGYKVSFAYSPTGQRTNMVDASGTTAYTYDNRDRLKSKACPEGTLTYTYDDFGNLATVQSSTANGTSVAYSYDELNRLTSVGDRFTNSTVYGYDAVGNLQTTVLPNGVTNAYAYDLLNRLTNLVSKSSGGTIASFAYKLAPYGNRTNLSETINGTSSAFAWQYDALYRLTNETITGTSPTGTISYKYDATGNRTNRTSTVAGISSASYSYNSNDQLVTDSYDANGNTTNSASVPYRYDAENRLTNYNNGATTFVYDGDGNRVRKTVSGVTTYYLIDDHNPSGYPQVLEELSTVGLTPTRLYTYGLDLISQRQSNGTTSFYGFDGNGNTRFLTGATGAVSDTYSYDAFGTLIASAGTTPNSYLYSGEQYDFNLGFYYLRARYMNPATGRFWTRNSFEGDTQDPISLHKYLYTRNDPIDNTDPSGLFTSAFGYAAHDAIQAIYLADHPGENVIVGTTKGLLGTLLKPDIMNFTRQSFAEIKPLSISGVAKGGIQIGAYLLAFGPQHYFPDASWTPSTHFVQIGEVPIVFVNVGGLVFYTQADENAKEVLALASIQAVKAYLTANQAVIARGIIASFGRIRTLAQVGATADTVRVQDELGISSLLSTIGGIAL